LNRRSKAEGQKKKETPPKSAHPSLSLIGPAFQRPPKLKFNFFFGRSALMLDADDGVRRYYDPFTGHLNGKAVVLLDAVSQPTQLLSELPFGITLFDVTLGSLFGHCHLAISFPVAT
jgi:hypothetical protein